MHVYGPTRPTLPASLADSLGPDSELLPARHQQRARRLAWLGSSDSRAAALGEMEDGGCRAAEKRREDGSKERKSLPD